MSVHLPKTFIEDQNKFNYWKEDLEGNENDDSKFYNFSSIFNSPNFINYETNEEFIENFLRIATPKKQELNSLNNNQKYLLIV
jgi:hypothetical protein